MTMLAWLMRGGWVTQLCTFAYVVVWPEIIYEVEYALEAEDIAKAKRAETQGGEPSSLDSTNTASSSSNTTTTGGEESPDVSRNPSLSFDTATSEPFGLHIINSTSDLTSSTATLRDLTLSPTQSELPTPPSTVTTAIPVHNETGSRTPSSLDLPPSPAPHNHNHHHHHSTTPAEAAAEKARLERLASRAARDLADRATAHARKAAPRATAHPSINDAPHLVGTSPHVILDAKKATGRESLYLDAIGRRLLRAGEVKDADATPGEGNGQDAGIGNGRDKTAAESDGLRGEVPSSHAARNTNLGGRSQLGTASKQGGVGGKEGPGAGGKDWDERVAAAWPLFWKYFNGRCALERIALQEDMKRKDAWNLLTGMSEYLLTVRHW